MITLNQDNDALEELPQLSQVKKRNRQTWLSLPIGKKKSLRHQNQDIDDAEKHIFDSIMRDKKKHAR